MAVLNSLRFMRGIPWAGCDSVRPLCPTVATVSTPPSVTELPKENAPLRGRRRSVGWLFLELGSPGLGLGCPCVGTPIAFVFGVMPRARALKVLVERLGKSKHSGMALGVIRAQHHGRDFNRVAFAPVNPNNVAHTDPTGHALFRVVSDVGDGADLAAVSVQ